MMLKSFNAQKASNAAVIYHFRTYAPTHAFARDDGLHRSRRGGMFFLSRARERTKERTTLRLFCHTIHHQ